MHIEFDSARVNGQHGDKPTHKLKISAEEPDTVFIEIENADTRTCSAPVVVHTVALIQALGALKLHEARVFLADAEHRRRHVPKCKECLGIEADGTNE